MYRKQSAPALAPIRGIQVKKSALTNTDKKAIFCKNFEIQRRSKIQRAMTKTPSKLCALRCIQFDAQFNLSCFHILNSYFSALFIVDDCCVFMRLSFLTYILTAQKSDKDMIAIKSLFELQCKSEKSELKH